ncbi:sensor histidine kinase [Aliiroseovarius marinus]|uniref:sensor histidine kinase n=1 Tax=Aliiroseovarius marinus TaxID=2500159 RepID=UPI003D7D5C82
MRHILRLPTLFAIITVIALLSAGVWSFAYRAALGQLNERAELDLALASDRLTGHLLQYRELAVVLSEHPVLRELLAEGGDTARAEAVLLSMADKTGARSIELVGRNGEVLATSSEDRSDIDTTRNPLARALNGALGTANRVTPAESGLPQRLFSFAAPIFDHLGPPVGAVIVEVDIWLFEQNWPTSEVALYFSDANGRVFVSNRSELVLAEPWSDEGFVNYDVVTPWTGQTIWRLDGGPYLPQKALYLERDLPIVGLTGAILADVSQATSTALLQASVLAAISLVFATIFVLAAERRRALSEKLEFEAAANARLEIRVKERTQALSEANVNLRREVTERKEAEAALRTAQAELVQAGKLTALGKMSAGISHELNQPLMAIRSFADNGVLLADKGDQGAARDNLTRVSELARRMGRIIKNLRAFARQESEPIGDVDLVKVVDEALEVCGASITGGDVTLCWDRPQAPVMVRGGEVRLQQVVVNLVSNGVDAMVGCATRHLKIALEDLGDTVVLSVCDTGPGLEEPERVFDPFYSTKQVGGEDGMGLGLSISYGLVQSFGGAIRGQNHPQGGAIFTVELNAARPGETI